MLLSVLVSSCEKDEQPPMNGTKMPISLAIVVIDKDSVNLLNDSITRAEYIKNMRFIYRDSSFACSGEIKKPFHTDGAFWGDKNNKYLSSIDLKIRDCYDKNWMPYTYYAFFFGEFGPNKNFQDEWKKKHSVLLNYFLCATILRVDKLKCLYFFCGLK